MILGLIALIYVLACMISCYRFFSIDKEMPFAARIIVISLSPFIVLLATIVGAFIGGE